VAGKAEGKGGRMKDEGGRKFRDADVAVAVGIVQRIK
jgi:hypothetical protein